MSLKNSLAFSAAILLFTFLFKTKANAQSQYELNSGWKCEKATDVHTDGASISKNNFAINTWENATVPGTVLTTQLNNKQIISK